MQARLIVTTDAMQGHAVEPSAAHAQRLDLIAEQVQRDTAEKARGDAL